MGTRVRPRDAQSFSNVNVSDWKLKYRAINAKAQERLLAMKWGQLSEGYDATEEGPAGSDTSNPGNEYYVDGDVDEDYNMTEDED